MFTRLFGVSDAEMAGRFVALRRSKDDDRRQGSDGGIINMSRMACPFILSIHRMGIYIYVCIYINGFAKCCPFTYDGVPCYENRLALVFEVTRT